MKILEQVLMPSLSALHAALRKMMRNFMNKLAWFNTLFRYKVIYMARTHIWV